jgi:hypothetical protein
MRVYECDENLVCIQDKADEAFHQPLPRQNLRAILMTRSTNPFKPPWESKVI